MNTKQKKIKLIDFDEYLKEELKNPEFRRLYDEYGRQLEISYQILQMRKKAKMSQAALAKKIGTTQSNVARMETGNQNFTIGMLDKVARVFNRDLQVLFD